MYVQYVYVFTMEAYIGSNPFSKKKTNLCSAFNSVEEVAPISNKLVHSQVVPYFHFLSPSYLYT